jgi:hypothetical protein
VHAAAAAAAAALKHACAGPVSDEEQVLQLQAEQEEGGGHPLRMCVTWTSDGSLSVQVSLPPPPPHHVTRAQLHDLQARALAGELVQVRFPL